MKKLRLTSYTTTLLSENPMHRLKKDKTVH